MEKPLTPRLALSLSTALALWCAPAAKSQDGMRVLLRRPSGYQAAERR